MPDRLVFIIFCLAVIVSPLQLTHVLAGDEDMNPSLYQRFDPETGYMITIDQAPVQSNHSPIGTPDSKKQIIPDSSHTDEPVSIILGSFIWFTGISTLFAVIGIILYLRRNRSDTSPS